VNYYATFATHFGSLNYKFKAPGEETITTVPDGVAHFLEHKLFEEEDGINALDKLSKVGANANAYTSFNHTAYLFSCNSRFDEAFDILLSFVQNPYLTDENVTKEKGIIAQEIKMYDDDPDWQVYFDLLYALYGDKHAVTKDIAGTVESIGEITPEILYRCYNTFYDPSNMVICVSGDVDPERVLEKIKISVKSQKEKPAIERYYGEITPGVFNKKIEKKMDVSIPMTAIGFKDTKAQRLRKAGYSEDNYDLVKRDVAIEILLAIIAGDSSNVFEELYKDGTITKSIGGEFTFEEDYAFSAFSFESENVDKVVKRITDEIEKLKAEGISDAIFERTKKTLYGGYVRTFNDSINTARAFTSDYFKGVNSFDFIEAYKTIEKDYVLQVLKEHFDTNNMAVSTVLPND
jgi:predicted Zn-dependent peptidase